MIIIGLACSPCPGGAQALGVNLVPNPALEGEQGENGLPWGWQRPFANASAGEPSRVFICRIPGDPLGKCLSLAGGQDRNGGVWCTVRGIRPHTDYLLEFVAYRPEFVNGVYLEVEVFGQRHLINQHLSYGRWQVIFLRINSSNVRGKTRLLISNNHREVLSFGSPSLRLAGPAGKQNLGKGSGRLPNFIPVGIFGANPEDLPEIGAAGFNAVQSYESAPDAIRALAEASARQGLKILPNFRQYQAAISQELGGRSELLGFYVEDEPEGRSVPPNLLRALNESLKQDHAGVLTAVAMLRPQMVAEYREATDVFLLDPYPVPNMPMSWLADTIEEAARHASRERLWAVVQAFGGAKFQKEGWPRPPTLAEMRCLTYLALVHGVHGLFYFSYPEVRADAAAWEDLKKIVGELGQLHPWLMAPNSLAGLRCDMTSPFKADANGRPAVHFCHKRRGKEDMLILVNVIDRPVNFYLQGFQPSVPCLTEFFRQSQLVVRDGNIRGELAPYEVRVYRYCHGD